MSDFRIIPLSRGLEALVDEADYPGLAAFKWHALSTSAGFYAARGVMRNRVSKTFLMHRVIMDAPAGLQVDHINGVKLDNRRSNLRLCTARQNIRNAPPRADNTSGFKGVCFHVQIRRWTARIHADGRAINLGTFSTKEDAARAYDAAARIHHGDFAYLNFPEAA